jgi:hypothetical protein
MSYIYLSSKAVNYPSTLHSPSRSLQLTDGATTHNMPPVYFVASCRIVIIVQLEKSIPSITVMITYVSGGFQFPNSTHLSVA